MTRLKRFFLFSACAVFAAAVVPLPARGQDEGPWKHYVTLALDSASQKNYAASEQFFLKALREAETFGANDFRVGSTLNGLGLVYREEKKYSEAEAAYRRALGIMQAAYGENLDFGNVSFNIANVMFDQGREVEALPVLQKTLPIYEKFFGPTSMKTAAVICMQGDVYRILKRYSEAETFLRKCSDIRETDMGIESTELADAQYSLALTLMAQGKFSTAEPRLRMVEGIREKKLGITDPLLAQTMEDHAVVLKQLGRDKEAEQLMSEAAAIRRSQKK